MVITLVHNILSGQGETGRGKQKQTKQKIKNRASHHLDSTIAETWLTDFRKIELLCDILDNKGTHFSRRGFNIIITRKRNTDMFRKFSDPNLMQNITQKTHQDAINI